MSPLRQHHAKAEITKMYWLES